MSTRVLVVPEDPTLNGYILKPLVERVLESAGRPKAQVLVLANPRTRGFDDAVEKLRSSSLRTKYGHFDLWLFLPDADRASGLEVLESDLNEVNQEIKARLFCCAAMPELEAWVLAGFRVEVSLNWNDVRAHKRLKEDVFLPFLAKYGNRRAAGEGREELMRRTLKNYPRLVELCPEIKRLEDRIRGFFENQA